MAEIVLIRHGQASFGAANYDQLSDLGIRQAQWLGQHFQRLQYPADRIVMGSMVRHRQTTEAILHGMQSDLSPEIHAGLDEYHFQGLLQGLQQHHPELWQDTGHAKRDYFQNMKQALAFWMDGTIETDGKDSWADFCQRIQDGLAFAQSSSARRVLLISSGGPIAVILAEVLKLSGDVFRQLTLQIKNTSCSKLLYNGREMTLDSFNDVGHLLTDERQPAITFS